MNLNYLLEKEIRYKKGLSFIILVTFDRKRTLLILGKFNCAPDTMEYGKMKKLFIKDRSKLKTKCQTTKCHLDKEKTNEYFL